MWLLVVEMAISGVFLLYADYSFVNLFLLIFVKLFNI